MRSLLLLFLATALVFSASLVDPRWAVPAYVTPGGTFNATFDGPVMVKTAELAAPGVGPIRLEVVSTSGAVATLRVPPGTPVGLYDLVINGGEVYEPKAVWVGNVTGPLRIIQLTDVHVGVELDMASVYRLIHGVLVANSGPYDVIFFTGDLADVGGQVWHYALFVRYASMATKPVFAIPGNHDHAGDDPLVNYRRFVGPPVWYRVVGPYLIIGLDSGENGFLTDGQVKLYEEVLKRYPDKVKIVLVHHPPFYLQNGYVVETYRGPQDVDRLNRDPTGRRSYYIVYTSYLQNRPAYEKFLDLTIRYKVALVMAGHVHSGNSTIVINGTYFVTTRTLGGSIDTSHGFRTYVVYPDGRVEVSRETWTYKNFAVATWGSRAAQFYIDSEFVGGVVAVDLPGNYTGVRALQGDAKLLDAKVHPMGKYARYTIAVSGRPVWLAVGDYAPAPTIKVEKITPRSPTTGDLVTINFRAEDPAAGVPFIVVNGTRVLASYLEEQPVYIYRFKYSKPVQLSAAAPGGQPLTVQIGAPTATPSPTPTQTTPQATPTATTPAPTPTPQPTTTTTPQATPPSPIASTPTATQPTATVTSPTPTATSAPPPTLQPQPASFPVEAIALIVIAIVGAVVVAALARRR
ncbi:metallophosphoesterase family protein [Pyrobaculum calidifontis]|uniref:Metallophosphoesterase n=1 Tax=Pyrobaculum calidifontis (strain DSM 21063 / JCM 11548 / VA1) TaxID=410359 RepID=A3MSS0_PYRCJ|nr:metallophosphoesterase [Pyrobaculum calidifontis]ABO07687.1 metallophosphoesterase [Pyrobaculum calidifontis JCM 11548]